MSSPMNKSVIIAIVIAVAISVWLGSGLLKEEAVIEAKSVVTDTEEKEVKVLVQNMKAQDHANIIKLYGQTKADRDVEIKAETSGRIQEVLVEKGTMVKKGDVIARITMDDRQRRLRSAESLVRQRELEFEASRKLSQKSFRSQTKLAEADALLDAARAERESIRVDINHTVIKAPFDGRLEDRAIEVGDYVTQGTLIAHIVDLSPIVVSAEIAESDISKIRDGQPAQALLGDGRQIDGIIRYVSTSSDKQTRTYRIEIESANSDFEIATGLTAQVRLQTSSQLAYRLSPAILTLSDQGVIGVKTVNSDNLVEFYPVGLLEDTAEGVWVSGLPQQARIITRGQEYVVTGQKVAAIEGDESKAAKPEASPALAKAQGE